MGFQDNLYDVDERPHPGQTRLSRSEDVVGILASIAPNLPKILVEQDRVLSAANTISASVIGPTFKGKSFPENVSKVASSLPAKSQMVSDIENLGGLRI